MYIIYAIVHILYVCFNFYIHKKYIYLIIYILEWLLFTLDQYNIILYICFARIFCGKFIIEFSCIA